MAGWGGLCFKMYQGRHRPTLSGMETRSLAVAVLASVALLAGCSSSPPEVDDATLVSELRSAGVEPAFGIASWRAKVPPVICGETDEATSLMLTMRLTRPQIAGLRVAAVHFCPERVPMVDEALARAT